MKGLKLTGAIIFALLMVISCRAQNERRSDFDIRGRVTGVNREGSPQNPRLRARVTVEAVKEASASNDRAVVFITDDTRLYDQRGERREPANIDAIRIGQQVEVRFAGPALMSYPVQATAGEIVILAAPSQNGQRAGDSADPQAAPNPDTALVRRAVEAGNALWVAAWAKGDASAVAATFTTDGSLLAQQGRVIKGRQQLLEYARDWMRRFGGSARLKVTTTDLWLDGETAYETGIARYDYIVNSQPQRVDRRYFTIWRRQADNSWKIFMDVGMPLNQAPQQ